jgi:hypothetical protein
MYSIITAVIAVVVGVTEAGSSVHRHHSLFVYVGFALFVELLGVSITEAVLQLWFWGMKRSSAKRLRQPREVRATTVWVGSTLPAGLMSPLGLITIGAEGFQYGSNSMLASDEVIAIAWGDVESVVFRPKFQFLGRLILGLRGRGELAWWIWDDCKSAFDALARMRDAT